jgi:hypothetical protein
LPPTNNKKKAAKVHTAYSSVSVAVVARRGGYSQVLRGRTFCSVAEADMFQKVRERDFLFVGGVVVNIICSHHLFK